MTAKVPYNPLDKLNLAKSVAENLLARSAEKFPPLPFNGAGIYAIYYVGDFPLYKVISDKNKSNKFELPIYIGKAQTKGTRKGGGFISEVTGKYLYNRLCDHSDSIKSVNNLHIEDFFFKYLIVDEIWIPLGESALIDKYQPLWNLVVEGFGNHDPGAGRISGKKPSWDVLHPGRSWANKLSGGITLPELKKEVIKFLSKIK